ncbi:hypothetical protein JTB14_034117 [Gonioctena quinquepunctata]|nr:hypothetical protein JTB14_034117 [Gonioctena quinquepunctata]
MLGLRAKSTIDIVLDGSGSSSTGEENYESLESPKQRRLIVGNPMTLPKRFKMATPNDSPASSSTSTASETEREEKRLRTHQKENCFKNDGIQRTVE